MADDEQRDEGFVERIKESPRTVSAIIIILIVAAAIYAFSDDQQQIGGQPGVGGPAVEEEEGEATETPAVADGEATDDGEETDSEDMGETAGDKQELPAAERTGQGYVEVAQGGDGITHLARRATRRWLAENQAGYTVTAEHQIYVEDYIQNRLGTQRLAVGEQMTVSFDLISEAVASAQQLSDGELANLGQYTSALQ